MRGDGTQHASQKRAAILARARRVVVKLGSSVLTTTGGVRSDQVGRISAEIAALADQGLQVIVVTSGARAAGLARLGLKSIPKKIPEQQAAAAIGQIALMALYERYFSDFHKHVGQVLLTADDLRDRTRYLNAKRTFAHLLRHGIVPIVNENDSVATHELKFGDNDRLSALVAGLVDADLLVILSDVEGLYATDPRLGAAPLIEVVEDVDAMIASGIAGGSGSAVGTGGMSSKLAAARSAAHRGIATIVASGMEPGVLPRIFEGPPGVGTLFLPYDSPIRSRKHWIAYGLPLRGALVLDDGAARAVAHKGSSLLAAGIAEVQGNFASGDCVSCLAMDGSELARGLVNYDSSECSRIRGHASARIQEVLGYHAGDEVIHRDDLVLLSDIEEERETAS
ncbi:MAG TPA: glutamate 5-kinase [Candidatus Limnocylindrales bacterium]|nr:glutamate 5-kinase [Candidatus Limnocylindrales bacterium]